MMTWVWLGAIVAFGILEALTAGLVSIWFMAGGLASLLAAIVGLGTTVQVVLFILVSAAALILTRPLVKRCTQGKTVPTNADRILGQSVKVTETIDNGNSTGAVYADGKTWSARSITGETIPSGEVVLVEKMEGVKLFVKLAEKTEVTA